MPFRLLAPILKDFILVRTDELFQNTGEATKVTIRQASQIDNERRSQVLAKNTRIFDGNVDQVRVTSEWSFEELKRMEAKLTLVGCNIESEDGKSLFRFKTTNGVPELDMNDREFERAWGALPGEIANEIYEKVLEVNLDWQTPLTA